MVLPPADARLRLRITAASGGVKVTAERRSDVVVDRGGSAVAGADGTVEIRTGRPSNSLDVRCPEDADVMIGTRSGRVELVGRLGTVGVTSQSGSIRVETVAEADLRTVSGTVKLDGCEGRCRVSTTSGRIKLGTTGDTEISTKSGSVDVGSVAGAFQVRSVSGTVKVASSASGPVKASTVSGSITIRLPAGVRPTVRSSGRGTVKSSFEAGDDVLIDIATVSGSVHLVST
jgi:hypothetical protein